jgi:hypothetical protein
MEPTTKTERVFSFSDWLFMGFLIRPLRSPKKAFWR